MKLTLKLFLVISLFCSAAFAEGDMTSGGYTCEGDTTSGGYTCEEGDMTSGGRTCNCPSDSSTANTTNQEEAGNSILTIVQEYLNSLFGPGL